MSALKRAAWIAWVSAVLVLLAYFVLLLPHISRITPDHLNHGVFIGAITIAFSWMPLLLLRKQLKGTRPLLSSLGAIRGLL